MRPQRPDRFDLVVFGDRHRDWVDVLVPDSPIWEQLPEVQSVSWRGDHWTGDDGDPATRLILPLLEVNIRTCPPGWALVPMSGPLEILADKSAFARYLASNNLERYAPATVWRLEDAQFPLVVKRTNLYGGLGVRVVHSAEHLTATLTEEPWAGEPWIVQEFVGGGFEYVLHAVVADGIFVWTAAHEVVIPPGFPIRTPRATDIVSVIDLPVGDMFALQRIIAPMGFSGPVNFNYRRRPGRDLALFEINPRMGGSMFRPVSRQLLPQMLRAIIAHAQWHEPEV